MVTKFRKTNPDFYNGYFAARVIVNRAATHAAPKPPSPHEAPPILKLAEKMFAFNYELSSNSR